MKFRRKNQKKETIKGFSYSTKYSYVPLTTDKILLAILEEQKKVDKHMQHIQKRIRNLFHTSLAAK